MYNEENGFREEMMKNVIHIFGASGSGTTTLAKKISRELNFFFMDTDDYYWMPTEIPFTVKRPAEDRLALMKKDIVEHENVVLSGSLTEWGDALIPYFTLAVRVVTDTGTRVRRLAEREYSRFGDRIREGGDMYEAHLEFLAWAARYDEGDAQMRSRTHHDMWQKRLLCPILKVDGAEDLNENFRRVKKALYEGER